MDGIPLRVEFRLDTPWSPPQQPIHFDGLIAWAIVERSTREGAPFTYDEVHADLPFCRDASPLGSVWMASMLQPQGIRSSERRYMTEKTASHELAERTVDGQMDGRPLKAIDTVRGMFKNGALWYTEETLDSVVAWCVTPDPDRLVPLLDEITHVGKRRRLDLGRVGEVQVVEDPEAFQRWRFRNMPEPLEGYVPVIGRLAPPYWQGEGSTTVWRPL